MMDFVSKTRNFVLKTSNYAWKTRNCALKMMIFAGPCSATVCCAMQSACSADSLAETAAYTDFSATDQKWNGFVLSDQSKKLYAIPGSATAVLIIDALTATADNTTISGLSSQTNKWAGGVQSICEQGGSGSGSGSGSTPGGDASDGPRGGRRRVQQAAPPDPECSNTNGGLIFAIPFNANAVLVIDPSDDTYDDTTIAVDTGNQKWWHGARSAAGLIYGFPYQSSDVLVIDPETLSATTIPAVSGFRGGVYASGSIFGMPAGATGVLKISPTTSTVTTIGTVSATESWDGAILAPNGKIYAIPSSASAILVIDPSDDSVGLIESCAQRENAWAGGVLGPNGRIYGIPYASDSMFEFDPNTEVVSTYTRGLDSLMDGSAEPIDSALFTDSKKWRHGTLGPDGRIYAAPADAGAVLSVCVPCQAGTEKAQSRASKDDAACAACPVKNGAPTFSATDGSSCEICHWPYVVNDELTSCTICNAGTGPNAQRAACVACQGLTFSTEGSGFCDSCDSLDSVVNTAKTSCTACDSGYEPNAARDDCIACTAGMYSPSGSECLVCSPPLVALATFPGGPLTLCQICAAGEGPDAAYDACELCDSASHLYSVVGECQNCTSPNVLKFTTGSDGLERATGCARCSAGFGPNDARTLCGVCPAGFYSSTGVCDTCENGEEVNSQQTDCDPCENGEVSAGVACRSCPAGTQPNGAQDDCSPCLFALGPAGFSSDGISCTSCVPGAEPQDELDRNASSSSMICDSSGNCPTTCRECLNRTVDENGVAKRDLYALVQNACSAEFGVCLNSTGEDGCADDRTGELYGIAGQSCPLVMRTMAESQQTSFSGACGMSVGPLVMQEMMRSIPDNYSSAFTCSATPSLSSGDRLGHWEALYVDYALGYDTSSYQPYSDCSWVATCSHGPVTLAFDLFYTEKEYDVVRK